MKENSFLSSRPIALPSHHASALDYRVIEFRLDGRTLFVGDCRMDGDPGSDMAVRIFFRPPGPSHGEGQTRALPEQPVAPDNADMFLTEFGLDSVRVPAALTDPCFIDLEAEVTPLTVTSRPAFGDA